MNKQEKCGYWLMLSDYDLGTIDALVQGERWVYVAYLCQQAVERQLIFARNKSQTVTVCRLMSYMFSA